MPYVSSVCTKSHCNLTPGLSAQWGSSAAFPRFYYSEQQVNTTSKLVASPPIPSRPCRVARTLDQLLGDELSLLSSSRPCNKPCSEEGCTKETSTTAQRCLETTPEASWGTASPPQNPSPLLVYHTCTSCSLILFTKPWQTNNSNNNKKGKQTRKQTHISSQSPHKPWKTGIWFVTSYSWSTKAKSKPQVTQEVMYQQFSSPKFFQKFWTRIASSHLFYPSPQFALIPSLTDTSIEKSSNRLTP